MSTRSIRKDPISISFTGWKRYKTCPQAHFLVMTGQRPKVQDVRNFVNGNVIHKLMEDFVNGEVKDISWLSENIEKYWHEHVENSYIIWKGETDKGEQLQKAIDWAAAMGDIVTRIGFDCRNVHSEKKVERFIEVDGYKVKLTGFIDLLVPLANNEWAVFDYKASQSKSVIDPWQVVFYSLLMDVYDDNPKFLQWAGFILPAFSDVFVYQITEAHREWLMQDICRVVRKIIADDFTPDPDDSKCFRCDVNKVCPVRGGAIPAGRGRMEI